MFGENLSMHTTDTAETTSQMDSQTDARTYTRTDTENITPPALPNGGGGTKIDLRFSKRLE